MIPSQHLKIPFYSSLVFRSQLAVFLLLSACFIISGFFYLESIKETERSEILEEADYIMELTVKTLALPLWNLDTVQLKQYLTALNNTDNYCGARIKDARGDVYVDAEYPRLLSSDQISQNKDIYFHPPNSSLGQQVIGSLDLCIRKNAIEDRVNADFNQHVRFFFVVIIMSSLASFFSQLILTRPLNKISKAMKNLTSEWHPITEPQLLKDNEIGVLAKNFNKMVEDLSATYSSLTKAKENAEIADKAKTNFLSNMTHELRTPLNSIIGMTRMLRERKREVDEKEMLRVIFEASGMLLETVDDILDITKIEAQSVTLERIGFDLKKVIDQSITVTEPLAKQKNLAFHATIDEGLPYVIGDSLRMGQIIRNLLSNAIKYTESGSISVAFGYKRLEGNRIELTCSVIDTGIGIPEDKLEKLFKKFSQVDISSTRKYGGTGLGLAITKELVELMHGNIGVESVKDKGTKFWFTIPFVVTQTLQEDIHGALEKKRAQRVGTLLPQQVRILVAEDHLLNQIFIKMLLEKYNFRHFDLVSTGSDVLKALSQKPYDILLLDCFMPEMNGFEVAQRIRTQEKDTNKHLPIVAVTANAMIGDEEKCLAAGMDDYIPKPIIDETFVEVMSQWIRFDDGSLKHELKGDGIANEHAPVNMKIIRSFSRGDLDIEKKLMLLFISQSDKHMEQLKAASDKAGMNEAWVLAAHSLKGGAASVGAEFLRALCAKAQLMDPASAEERAKTFKEIEEKYALVRENLLKRTGSI